MRNKVKILLSGIAVLVLLLGATAYYEYHQLRPSEHFKNVPLINANELNKISQKDHKKTVSSKQNVFNILLIGSDERKGQKIGHSDSMILVHVDLNKHVYHAVSIPRDTRVYLDGYGYTKLTSVQFIKQATVGQKAGVKAAIKEISDLTGAPINYYVETNYTGLQSMVDALGTVTINVPFNVTLTHPWYPEDKNKVIKAGKHTLDGKMVTELVHERDSLPRGEYDRQLLQEKALIGIAKTALEPKNFTKLPKFAKTIDKFIIDTNMSTSDMISLGLALKNFDPNTQLKYYQLKGTNKKMYDDILKAYNDEIIIKQTTIDNVMKKFNQ